MWRRSCCIFVVLLTIADNAEANTIKADPMESKVIKNSSFRASDMDPLQKEQMIENTGERSFVKYDEETAQTRFPDGMSLRQRRLSDGQKPKEPTDPDAIAYRYLGIQIIKFVNCFYHQKKADGESRKIMLPPGVRRQTDNVDKTPKECAEILRETLKSSKIKVLPEVTMKMLKFAIKLVEEEIEAKNAVSQRKRNMKRKSGSAWPANEKNVRNNWMTEQREIQHKRTLHRISADNVDNDSTSELIPKFKVCVADMISRQGRNKLSPSRMRSPRFRKSNGYGRRSLSDCIKILEDALKLAKITSAKLKGEIVGLWKDLMGPSKAKPETRGTSSNREMMFGRGNRAYIHRVVGGTDAPDGKYPYMVSLRQGNEHLCGGSIISDRWILTAAHCLLNDAENMTAVVGASRLDEGSGSYPVEIHVAHPNYPDDRNYDIGLVRVGTDIVFDDKVQPIKLPTDDSVRNPVVLAGWGRTLANSTTSNALQHIKLTVISNLICKILDPTISEVTICTLTQPREGFCWGDSGGPLVSDGVQVGIVSRGLLCAHGYPDVYTRVWSFFDWIIDIMSETDL